MASILAGKYTYDTFENLMEFFKGLGVPEEAVDKVLPKPGTIREIAVDGNKILASSGKSSTTLILNQEVEETNEDNLKFKSTATLEGNILKVRSVGEHFVLNRHYEFNEKGIIATVSSDKTNIVAKVYLKRV